MIKLFHMRAILYAAFLLFHFAAQPLHCQERGLFRVNEHSMASSGDVKVSWLLPAYVSRAVDGDTIIADIENPPYGLAGRERVRFLGVDTPETVHPAKPVEYFGKEASDYTKYSLENKMVYLAFDWGLRDRYGRLLAYIYIADGVCFNAVQIINGYASAYTRFPFQFLQEFRRYEAEAKKMKAGMWD